MNMRDKIAGILDEHSVHAEDGHSLDYLADVIIAALDTGALVRAAMDHVKSHLAKQAVEITGTPYACGPRKWCQFVDDIADDPEAMAAIKAKAGWV